MNARCIALAIAACLALAAAAPALSPTQRAAAVRYHRLLDAAKAAPEAADWTALRAAYAASPAYDPAAGHTQAEAAMAATLQRGDNAAAAALAEQATARNWMDLRAHVMAYLAYTKLHQPDRAAPHQRAAQGITRALRATGDGASPATAIHVLATSEEYVLLLFMHLQSVRQSLIPVAGHTYDRLDATPPAGGTPRQLWFNIDVSLAREAAVSMGGAVPIPDSALPD